MQIGKLRHRITIQSQAEVQDASGDVTLTWTDAFPAATALGGIPASWLAGPGREYMAAESIRSEVTGRFELRYLAGVTAAMRVLWDGNVYNVKAPPAVDPTGRRYMTLMVGSGANNG